MLPSQTWRPTEDQLSFNALQKLQSDKKQHISLFLCSNKSIRRGLINLWHPFKITLCLLRMLWFSLQWYVSPEYYHKTLASFFVEHNCFLACETTKAWQKLLQFCMSECVSAFKYLCVCLVCIMINVNHNDDQRSLLFRSV